jgi:transcriptional regulator with XRE-family HTH domain
MFDTQKFGAYISHLRKNADMTQSELAYRLNITRQAVSKYEIGDSFPDITILVQIAGVFNISLDELIASGGPTQGESRVLNGLAKGEDATAENVEDVINLAPLLKPSALEKVSSKLAVHGIDISNIVQLSQYMNDASTSLMIQNADFSSLEGEAEKELMVHLMPLLDEKSKTVLFEKIIEGDLDWHYLEFMMPYITYLYSQIEAAYVEGAIPHDVMEWLRKAIAEESEKNIAERKAAMHAEIKFG